EGGKGSKNPQIAKIFPLSVSGLGRIHMLYQTLDFFPFLPPYAKNINSDKVQAEFSCGLRTAQESQKPQKPQGSQESQESCWDENETGRFGGGVSIHR